MQHGPGRHMALPEVKLDDVAGEGPVVVEGPPINHMAGADPVVGQLVGVGEAALEEIDRQPRTGRKVCGGTSGPYLV